MDEGQGEFDGVYETVGEEGGTGLLFLSRRHRLGMWLLSWLLSVAPHGEISKMTKQELAGFTR